MSVARIPFTRLEEGVLSQLAGWMTFVAVLHFVGGVLLLAGACLFLTMGSVWAGLAATSGSSGMGPFAGIAAGGAAIGILGSLVLLLSAITLVAQGGLLVQARSSFAEVLRTDNADQAHLSAGFRKLKQFFLIEVVLVGLGVLGSLLSLGSTTLRMLS